MKLRTYESDNNISLNDKLTGTDADDANKTKNYTFQKIKDFLIAEGLGGAGGVDISGKVDKVTGKSLILDTEITRLSTMTAIFTTALKSTYDAAVTAITGKEDTSNKSTNVTTDATSNIKYPSVKAVKDYVDANTNTAATAFVNKAYSATMNIANDSANPNFEIDITGNLNLTVTGTVNGNSGMVNLYFSGTEVATINGVKGLSLTGTGVMIPVYFIHDSDGIRWYDGREATAIDSSNLVKKALTVNLFDKTKIITGNNYDFATASLTYHPSLNRTDFIEIKPSTNYIMPVGYGDNYTVFDEEKVPISSGTSNSFTTGATVKYIIINVNIANINTIQLIEGTVLPPYVSYESDLKQMIKDLGYVPKPIVYQHYSHPTYTGRDVGNIISYTANGAVVNLKKDFIAMKIGDFIYLQMSSGVTMYVTADPTVTINGVADADVLLTGNGGLKIIEKVDVNAYTIIL